MDAQQIRFKQQKKKKKLVNIKLANIPLKYELCLIVGDQPVEATK